MSDNYNSDSSDVSSGSSGRGSSGRGQGSSGRGSGGHVRSSGVGHFEVCDKVHVKLDFDFALALGQFLLDSDLCDKRFKSFGHHLCNLEGE